MDLSNLLGIKKDKLIAILKNRSFHIQEIADNDLVVSKKLKIINQLSQFKIKVKKY